MKLINLGDDGEWPLNISFLFFNSTLYLYFGGHIASSHSFDFWIYHWPTKLTS